MEYRTLGRSGLSVSALCLGTMMFGQRTEEAEAERIVGSARDAGVNFVDTADAYGAGRSESMTGRLIARDRERWVVATKIANPMAPFAQDPNARGLSRKWMERAVDESLRRLGTDYLDILYWHKEDPDTPLEESIGAVGDLIRAGRIRYFGLSNFRAWRIAAVALLCDRMGVPRPMVCQPYYNAMNRMPEVEVLPACAAFGLGVVPYSPLARGVLTGKYAAGADPDPESRAGQKDRRMMETEFRPESMEIARRLKAHAEARGGTAIGLAVAWVLRNAHVSSVIAGPRTVAQWEAYLAALDEPQDAAGDEALLDSLVAPGHPSTPGFSDPQYPITGRPLRG